MPLDFSFSEEQNLFRESVREFAEKELAEKARYWDRSNEWPRESLKKSAKMELLGLLIPEEYGGQAPDWTTAGIAIEEISRSDPQCGLIIAVHTVCERFLYEYCKPQIKEKWISALAKGEKTIGIGVTEPGCGSDAAAMKTKAVKAGDEYVISGEKTNITGAVPEGFDAFDLAARTGPEEARHRTISAFLLEMDRAGIEHYELQAMAGGAGFGGIKLEDVRVPAENLLGEENKGFYLMLGVIDSEV